MGSQNSVSWTPEAEIADSRLNRLTLMGYVGIVFFAALAAAATYVMLKK